MADVGMQEAARQGLWLALVAYDQAFSETPRGAGELLTHFAVATSWVRAELMDQSGAAVDVYTSGNMTTWQLRGLLSEALQWQNIELDRADDGR